MLIVAKGTKDKKKMTVEYEDGEFTFDGEPDLTYETEIQVQMSLRHPIAGTFFTENENDPLNILNVLRYHFFDERKAQVYTKDDFPEMPSEEGVVY